MWGEFCRIYAPKEEVNNSIPKYRVGEKLVCIIDNSCQYAPCEIVEIEEIKITKELIHYKFNNEFKFHKQEYLDMFFRRY